MQTRRQIERAVPVPARFDQALQHIERPGQPTVELLLLQVIQLLQTQRQEVAIETQPVAQDETFNVKEAAKYLRMSEWTIYDMVRTKSIPNFRIRSRIFLRRFELDHWINQQQAVRR